MERGTKSVTRKKDRGRQREREMAHAVAATTSYTNATSY